jgi:hypothetical protein
VPDHPLQPATGGRCWVVLAGTSPVAAEPERYAGRKDGVMAFAELELGRVNRVVGEFCRRKSPQKLHDRVRIEFRVEGHEVLIYETRPAFRDPSHWVEQGVAKLRFVRTAGEWRLFWQRASLRWQSYEPLASSRDIEILLVEIDRDPHGCFFG